MTAPAAEPKLASRAPDVAFIFKKALISALVALVLFSLMIGIRTEAGPAGQLIYWTRFGDLAAVVAAVFGGSIVVELLRQWWGPVGTIRVVPPSVQSTLAVARRAIAPVLLIFTFLVPVIFYDQRYILDLGILVLTYVMLGWGLNVVVGLAGLLDLGYVAFYAVGAYSYALLATNFGLSFWVCLPLAGILAAFWGVLLGFPVLRLRGDYLAIVTLAFGEIIRLVIINWQSLTGGPNGVSGIPRPTFFGIPLTPGDDGLAARLGIEFSPTHRIVFLFYLILALALLTNWVTIRLRRLPIGRAWEALREDEVACRALGINTTTTKLTAFATGAMFGGFAGAFFATRQGFISPESFTFQESALVLAIVTLAFGEIIRLVIINWQSLTGGPNGVTGIPRPTLFGIPLTPGDDGLAAKLGIEFSPTHRIVFLFYLILALALLTNWVTIRLRRLPLGRAWEALREDEVACRALGINITTTKLTAFATGAMFGGFAGAFFATRQGFISPESFTFQESALVLAIVVLGGMGSQLGVALAALTMIGGFELFRGLDQYRMLVFGVAMVLLMIWRPRGLIGHRAPTVFLQRSQAISSDLVKEGHG